MIAPKGVRFKRLGRFRWEAAGQMHTVGVWMVGHGWCRRSAYRDLLAKRMGRPSTRAERRVALRPDPIGRDRGSIEVRPYPPRGDGGGGFPIIAVSVAILLLAVLVPLARTNAPSDHPPATVVTVEVVEVGCPPVPRDPRLEDGTTPAVADACSTPSIDGTLVMTP